MQISPDIIDYISRLSRLELPESEKEQFRSQFEQVTNYINVFSSLNLDDVEPLEHLVENTENRFREDTAHESLDVTEALQNAPKHNDVFFKVPKVLGGGES